MNIHSKPNLPLNKKPLLLRLSSLLALLVLATSLSITYWLWDSELQDAERELQTEFDFRVQDAKEDFEYRIQAYEQVLRGVAGLLSHSSGVSRQEFKSYFNRLHLEKNYRGILGVAFQPLLTQEEVDEHTSAIQDEGFPEYRVKPEGRRKLHAPIIYIEPFSEINQRALGYDSFSDPILRIAMEKARDTNKANISGKIILVQETGDDVQSGFVMYLPIYENLKPHDTLEERTENIRGWVSAPFRMNDLISIVFKKHTSLLDFEVYDGEKILDEKRMYDSDVLPGMRGDALFRGIQQIHVAGHVWTAVIHSHPEFEQLFDTKRVLLIAQAGVLISCLLTFLTWLLSSSRARALNEAYKMTRELSESKAHYQQMFDGTASICFLLDSEKGRIIDANPAAVEFWGYSLEQLQGMTIDQINIAPVEEIQMAMTKVVAKEQHHEEWQHRRENGEVRDVEVYSSPLIHQGKTMIYCLLHDISTRKKAEEALQQSLDFNKGILSSIPDLIWIKDGDGVYLACNEAFELFFGAKEEDILGKTDYDFVDKKLADFFRDNDLKAIEAGKPSINEESLTFATNGYHGLFETVKTPLYNKEGKLIGVLGVARDLTERLKIENALRTNEEKLRGLYELSPMGIALTDMKGHYLEFNDAFQDICGYSREELNKLDYWELTPEEYADKEAEQLKSLNTKGYYGPYEKEYICKDGSRVPLRLNGVLMNDHDGNSYIWSIVEDISERKNSEELLRKLSAAVEQNAAAVVIADLEGNIQYVNPHFTENTGYSFEDVLGQNSRILQSGQTPFETYEEMWNRLTSGVKWNGELLNKRKSGEFFWEAVSIAPVKDARGETTHYVGVKTEITERKKMEAALAESELRFRTLIENSPFCILEIDMEGCLHSINRAGLDMLGLDDEKKIDGLPYLHFIGEGDVKRVKGLLEKAIKGIASHFEFVSADNALQYFKSCLIPIRDDNDEVVRLMGITEDITERKRIEDALYFIAQRSWESSSENYFEALAKYLGKTLDVDYVIIDKLNDNLETVDTVALYANGQLAPSMSYELKGTPCDNVVDNEFCFYREGIQSLFPEDELLVKMKVEGYAGIPLWDSTGKALGLIAVLNGNPLSNETTILQLLSLVATRAAAELEHKLNENKLREQKDLLSSIFENALDAVLIMDSKGGITGWSKQAEEIFGWNHDEAVGRMLHETIIPPHYREQHLNGLRHFLSTGEGPVLNKRIEISALHRDGHEFPVEISISPIKTEEGYEFSSFIRDISERKRTQEALETSEREFRTLAENHPDNIARYDREGHLLYVNPALEQILDVKFSEVKGTLAGNLFNSENLELYRNTLMHVNSTGDDISFEHVVLVEGGERQTHFIHMVPEIGLDGKPNGVLAVGRDISERKQAEQNLRIIASVFDNSQEAILITNSENIITEVNHAFTVITGFERHEAVGHDPKMLRSGRHGKDFYEEMWETLKAEKSWRGEIWNRRKNGEIYAELLSISVIEDAGEVQRFVAVFSDISYLKEQEAALSRIAHYDALTGIPNRTLLADRMKHSIAQAKREQTMMAVCYLDLDGFKPVNDTWGHEAGDQVLIEIAKRLGDSIRGGDTVARLGGDEFVVLLLDLDRVDTCVPMLERLLSSISSPMEVKGREITLGASIGVSFYPLDEEDPATLLSLSDKAMYVAKQAGKNRFYIYDKERDQSARDHNEFLQDIRHGLKVGQFELHFQPKINLNTKEVVGAEALIRWNHPKRGVLFPGEFLNLIEKTEFDVEVGNWVITTALAQMHQWHHDGINIKVSVNVSIHHLKSHGFVEHLRQQLEQYPDIVTGSLQLEVLGTVEFEDLEIVRNVIEACQKFNVSFALDDFGTGFTSLSYLNSLPVDVLKIDRSFVSDLLNDPTDKSIVEGIIALADVFGRKTVVEGIEEEAHCQMLVDMGCDVGQGYGIARPMTGIDMKEWLESQKNTAKPSDAATRRL